MTELLKIQYGYIFVQVPVEDFESTVEAIDTVVDYLLFFKKMMKKYRKGEK